jgi:16S rRNA (cytosine1402-N4)-methyltransferase
LEFHHIPVLLNESLNGLNINPAGTYVDGTAGGAGHSVEIAKRLTTGRLVSIDKDPTALETVRKSLLPHPASVFAGDFGDIAGILDSLGIPAIDGILLDIGVSSHQLDTPERGFSYSHDAPLDMRMTGAGFSAKDLLNTYSIGEMTRVFRDYGEERFARRIAANICAAREQAPLETTFQLVEIIRASIPAAARREGGHPAKRVFQGVRIEVNGELEIL